MTQREATKAVIQAHYGCLDAMKHEGLRYSEDENYHAGRADAYATIFMLMTGISIYTNPHAAEAYVQELDTEED